MLYLIRKSLIQKDFKLHNWFKSYKNAVLDRFCPEVEFRQGESATDKATPSSSLFKTNKVMTNFIEENICQGNETLSMCCCAPWKNSLDVLRLKKSCARSIIVLVFNLAARGRCTADFVLVLVKGKQFELKYFCSIIGNKAFCRLFGFVLVLW